MARYLEQWSASTFISINYVCLLQLHQMEINYVVPRKWLIIMSLVFQHLHFLESIWLFEPYKMHNMYEIEIGEMFLVISFGIELSQSYGIDSSWGIFMIFYSRDNFTLIVPLHNYNTYFDTFIHQLYLYIFYYDISKYHIHFKFKFSI